MIDATVVEVSEDELELDAVTFALAMCPPGMAIEIHGPTCPLRPCACQARIIAKPPAS